MTITLAPDVLVAHPVPLLAAGVAAALAPATVATGITAARLLDGPAPAVLVTDLPLALAVLAGARPQPGRPQQAWRCVVLSTDAGCCQVRHALQHGVLGYLQAGCTVDELQRAVAAARRGQRSLCSAAASGLADAAVGEPLTPRETEVLQLLCLGLDNKTIALRLAMALGTVKTHVKAILDKLGASSRTQAVAAAHRTGLARLGAPPALATAQRPPPADLPQWAVKGPPASPLKSPVKALVKVAA